MLKAIIYVAATNNMTKSKINRGTFSSMLFLVVIDGLYYSCACIKEADEEIACGNAAFM